MAVMWVCAPGGLQQEAQAGLSALAPVGTGEPSACSGHIGSSASSSGWAARSVAASLQVPAPLSPQSQSCSACKTALASVALCFVISL